SQVIQNLVINADQAMDDHGLLNIQAANMRLSHGNPWSLKPGEYIIMEFRDNGPGIQAKDISRVFDPYFTTKQKGSGLGLAVACSIIRNHQGHISVTASPGRGALFTVILQATGDQPEPEEQEEHTARLRARILVLDDEPDILEVTAEHLREQGYSVDTAENGQEAVDKFLEADHKGQPFDLLITDLSIPGGLGGREVVQALKAHDPELTAVVSSGYPNDPVMARHQEFGFAARLVKPFRMQELDRVIKKCLINKTLEDRHDHH
ncbi:MAG: ATP-binding protein, partial [Desulfonatronovibrionaceae bacterium]